MPYSVLGDRQNQTHPTKMFDFLFFEITAYNSFYTKLIEITRASICSYGRSYLSETIIVLNLLGKDHTNCLILLWPIFSNSLNPLVYYLLFFL